MWILRYGKSISFLYDDWMEGSPLVDKITANTSHYIGKNVKVSGLNTPTKQWNTDPPINIIDRVKAIQIRPLNLGIR